MPESEFVSCWGKLGREDGTAFGTDFIANYINVFFGG